MAIVYAITIIQLGGEYVLETHTLLLIAMSSVSAATPMTRHRPICGRKHSGVELTFPMPVHLLSQSVEP